MKASVLAVARRLATAAVGRDCDGPVDVDRRPVFVLGHQKSGTSAVAGLLAHASGLSVTLDIKREIAALSYVDVVLGRRSVGSFVERYRSEFSAGIVKDPGLTLMTPGLSALFPQASFVFVYRDPRDTIRSILDRLGLSGDRLVLTREERASISPAWSLTLDANWLGLRSEGHIEALAHRWNHFMDLGERVSRGVVMVRYEEFRADRQAAISDLCRQLCLREVASIADVEKVAFQRPGRHRDKDVESFFAPEVLATIEAICGERMLKYHYDAKTAIRPTAP